MLEHVRTITRKIVGKRGDGLSGLETNDRDLIARIRSKNLTYLSDKKLRSVVECCRRIETESIHGVFIEAGCALGGSTILISSLKGRERPLHVYDVFDMIPPPSREDSEDAHDRYKTIKSGNSSGLGDDRYYGYQENLYEIVQANLASFGIDCEQKQICLIKGLVQDTMSIGQPVAFAHIDVDWYEPVKACLERVVPHLSPGGSVILDDYHDWRGCKRATDEYFRGLSRQFHMDDSAGHMKVTRRTH